LKVVPRIKPKRLQWRPVSKTFDTLNQVQPSSRSQPRLAMLQVKSARAASVIQATDCVDPLNPEARAKEGLNRQGTSRYRIWFFLGVLLLSAAVIFLRHYARNAAENRKAIEITSAGKVPGILSAGSTVQQPTPPLPATLSSNLPGFVLQVAAMKHEDNAEALAKTLHLRNFPVFVSKRGAGPFYLVTIGVYSDADSAVRVKDELERQGFKSILRRWLPE
jgi:septal ring-binding cell division protein DamX